MKSAVLSTVVFLLLISLFVYSCNNAVSPIANQTNSNFTLNVYVDVAGSDTNEGTKTSPFCTINKAISYAYDTLTKTNAQVNIYLKSGLYTEGSGFTTPITIKYNITDKYIGWLE